MFTGGEAWDTLYNNGNFKASQFYDHASFREEGKLERHVDMPKVKFCDLFPSILKLFTKLFKTSNNKRHMLTFVKSTLAEKNSAKKYFSTFSHTKNR